MFPVDMLQNLQRQILGNAGGGEKVAQKIGAVHQIADPDGAADPVLMAACQQIQQGICGNENQTHGEELTGSGEKTPVRKVEKAQNGHQCQSAVIAEIVPSTDLPFELEECSHTF